jgi:hypothetical protein
MNQIPKVVYQVYTQGYDAIPECVKKVIEENKRNNPNYKFVLYDYESIDSYLKYNTRKEIYDTFKLINRKCHACVADFFRYVIIYEEGGIYADIKTKFNKPLDSWVNTNDKIKLSLWPWYHHSYLQKYYPKNFIFETKNREINQSVLIYPKNHQILYEVINEMLKNINEEHLNPKKKQHVLEITGPHLYTKVIAPKLNDLDFELYQKGYNLFDNHVQYDGSGGCYHNHQNKNKLRYTKLDKIIL